MPTQMKREQPSTTARSSGSNGFFLFYFPPSLIIPEYLGFKPPGYWPPRKDTKTLIGYFKVPEINPQVIS